MTYCAATGSNVQFFGGNLRLGYSFRPAEGDWRIGLYGGAYYTTMVGNLGYGFNNLIGPQLYPTVRYAINSGNAVFFYGKYSPIANGASLLSLDNRELALGGGWQHALGNGCPLSVTFDFSNLHFSFSGTQVDASSMTLGMGYGFR